MNSILRPSLKIRLPSVSTSSLSKCRYNNPTYVGPGKIQIKGRFQGTISKGFESRIFQISEEVEEATKSNKPVVALESTIYTHGYSYPENAQLALDLEDIVRANGGIPATIGVLDGVACVGLTKEELIAVASAEGKRETMKVSRRDLPYILGMGISGRKITGGTTVAGTMILAQKAGISVFGTGGLGGVHRGGQDSMDISADLSELGRTAVAVISSGCKSFLDIPRTLEYLETQGAGVFTFADGRTGPIDYPAFYTRDSGVKSPMVVQNAQEAAAIIYAQDFFKPTSGFHFANPIPEEFSIPKSEIDYAIDQAVQEAAEQGFHGHRNTPFILARIKELTKGTSAAANRALIESNIKMATRVAIELSRLRLDKTESWNNASKVLGQPSTTADASRVYSNHPNAIESNSPKISNPKPSIVVVGSIAIDLSCDYTPRTNQSTGGSSPQMHTSNIAKIRSSIGGVGYNVLRAAQLSSKGPVSLYTFIADDQAGKTILQSLQANGNNTDDITICSKESDYRTAQYVAINDGKKDLVIAMADMDIFTRPSNDSSIQAMYNKLSTLTSSTKWIIIDGNWQAEVIQEFLHAAKSPSSTIKIAFEPVSTTKSARLFEQPSNPSLKIKKLPVYPNHIVDLATPNEHELTSMHEAATTHGKFESEEWWKTIDSLGIPSTGARDRFVHMTSPDLTNKGIPVKAIQLLPYIPTILTKLGAGGVLLTSILSASDARLRDPDHAPYILARCTNGNEEVGGVYMRLFPAVEKVVDGEVVSVNGVGDTFLGVLIAGLARGCELDDGLIGIAQRGAVMTLKSCESVSPEVERLSEELDGLYKGKSGGRLLK
ncbi:hypothetical protein sscle_01g002270 [Sclerotinia sclerotiorum 1980 UF-70]|uniref:Carbohydrate kinase PfkB domain-containing protein n=1 Tax=Sclerotinia sclerotiorum (strain ATCC 18683 / 1980 / Ss-1) TaxID=665079 RepID=A0A1D9PRY4_SCLS1|nr:hypothetical protein sscle_01g002270 [Sclerotinia sclerotiorum 1980 UF-70]